MDNLVDKGLVPILQVGAATKIGRGRQVPIAIFSIWPEREDAKKRASGACYFLTS